MPIEFIEVLEINPGDYLVELWSGEIEVVDLIIHEREKKLILSQAAKHPEVVSYHPWGDVSHNRVSIVITGE